MIGAFAAESGWHRAGDAGWDRERGNFDSSLQDIAGIVTGVDSALNLIQVQTGSFVLEKAPDFELDLVWLKSWSWG